MFFYLAYSIRDKHLISACKKLGITRRLPKHRIKEYQTYDLYIEYYAIAYFPNCSLDKLLSIEKNCLAATKQYNDRLNKMPNCESRYDISCEDLWNICINYFPNDTKYLYKHIDILHITHDEYPNLSDVECHYPKPFNNYQALQRYQPKPTFKPATLRGYQIEAYQELKNKLTKYNKCILNIMCRCGKTEIFKNYIYENQHKYKYIIYVAPRLQLIADIYKRFSNMLEREYISISSDNLDISIDDYTFHKKLHKRLMIFVCNLSFNKLDIIFRLKQPTLIVFDEAHRLSMLKNDLNPLMLVNKYDKFVDSSSNKYVNSSNKFIDQIFATATPIFGNYITEKCVYMNDPELFGYWPNTSYTFNNIELAIEQKFISPAKLVVKQYTDNTSDNTSDDIVDNTSDDISDDIKDNHLKDNQLKDKKCVHRIKCAMKLLKQVCRESPRKKILIYCSSQKTVNLCYDIIHKAKEFKVFKLISEMKSSDKAKTIPEFTKCKDPAILINCQMVTDGINIPELDTVIYVDPKYKKEDIIQSCMRPRSYYPDKTAYIIIPQIYDISNSSNGCFNTMLTIIKELHTLNDPIVVKYLSDISKSDYKASEYKSQDIQIDPDAIASIINLCKNTFKIETKQYNNLYECIINIMSDYIPRTIDDIKNIVNTSFKLDDVPLACSMLVAQSKLTSKSYHNNIYYFTSRPQKISTSLFYEKLRELNIYTESDYIKWQLATNYIDHIFVCDPKSVYKDFEWNKIDNRTNNYYTDIEHCRYVIDTLILAYEKEIRSTQSCQLRINFLRTLDNRIPHYEKIKEWFGIEPTKLHNGLNISKCEDLD